MLISLLKNDFVEPPKHEFRNDILNSDFDLRKYNGLSSLPCISHIASFQQNNLIAWKGHPRM